MRALSRHELIRRSSAALRAEFGCRTTFVANVRLIGDIAAGCWAIGAIAPGEAAQSDIDRARRLVQVKLASEYRLASD